MSSQIGWPEGARAACGSVRPSASATTCDVAAVPRNWQPPPGLAQARQPSSAASSSVSSPWAVTRADRLDLAGVFAVAGRQSHAAGDQHAGQLLRAGQGHHHGGQALVAGGDAQHALAARQRADQPAEDDGRVVAIGQAVHHPGRALGPAVARVGDHPGERDDVEALNSSAASWTSRPISQWPV